MKKVKRIMKLNTKSLIIGIILGLTIAGSIGVYAATVLASKDVTYSNTTSGLSATTVQGAIDELYKKAKENGTKCPEGYICEKIPAPVSFAADSWKTIGAAVKAGKASSYKVGDTKTIDMGSFGTHTVRVANTSACKNGETSQTACGFVIEFADIITTRAMNSSDTSVGGWPSSALRTYVNSNIYNALPSDLKSIIADTTVVSGHGLTSGETNFTSTDKLYLLSTKEVWNGGTGYDTAESATRQLDYYKNLGVTTSNYSGAIKKYNGSNKEDWWLRSASSRSSSYFFAVTTRGDWNDYLANFTYGVSPAFRIA